MLDFFDIIVYELLNSSIRIIPLFLAIVLCRAVWRKAPKWLICVMWAFLAVRLICPFSIESRWSLIPDYSLKGFVELVRTETSEDNDISNPDIILRDEIADRSSHSAEKQNYYYTNLKYIVSVLWVIGFLSIMSYASISYIRLRRKVISSSIVIQDNIVCCEGVRQSFVLGIFNPIINVADTLTEEEFQYVVLHEQAHINRRDNIWKIAAYLILTIYWFNPLAWISYILFSRDIEAACDETVIKSMDEKERKLYAVALLNNSINEGRSNAFFVAFGSAGVKKRIGDIMNYKKKKKTVLIGALIICSVIAVCFMTDPKENKASLIDKQKKEAVNCITQYYTLFEKENYDEMKLYCTGEYSSQYFHDSDVFGDVSGRLLSVKQVLYDERTDQFRVVVNVESVPGIYSANYVEDNRTNVQDLTYTLVKVGEKVLISGVDCDSVCLKNNAYSLYLC